MQRPSSIAGPTIETSILAKGSGLEPHVADID
jgi:hypothetical protein